jgi:AcrR family transcriptional regulator
MSYLAKEERRAQILYGAVRYFAEEGIAGQTRELSRRLGITQPLIYRYFPSKQQLLDAIFEELFVNRWDGGWKALITEASIALDVRIARFYREFDQKILSREWVRLFVFSGLSGLRYNQFVFRRLLKEIFRPLCVELRKRHGYPPTTPGRITRQEIEMVWELHGVVFYHRMREHVYGLKVTTRHDELIRNLLFYLEGAAPRLLAQILPDRSPQVAGSADPLSTQRRR